MKDETNIFDITSFGASERGISTAAVQRAIDELPKGGTVYIPKGRFLTGALFLKSDMTLYLAEGAELVGSNELCDYPLMQYRFEGEERQCYASLINTRDGENENISICGEGTIYVNAAILGRRELETPNICRGRNVCLRNTKNISISGITLRGTPAWCLHLIYCTDVSIKNIKIYTKYNTDGSVFGIYNGDGIDIDSCSRVEISDCMIASQDDCIAIKSGRDAEGRAVGIPSEDITITNCRFKSGFGVAIGSEMSGGIRNVRTENCTFENTFCLGSVKAKRGRGSAIEDIVFKNCTQINRSTEFSDCEWFRGALYVDLFYSLIEFDPFEEMPINDDTPAIRNVTFENIALETAGGNAVYMAGLPESPLENITLKNVKAKGVYGLKAYNIRGLNMENTEIEAENGEKISMINVEMSE